jgi:hypothetical protein
MRFRTAWICALALLTLSACKKLPDRGEIVDLGDSVYLEFAGTQLLIPKKSWLKGYGRNSTDGKVSDIILHALAPEVKAWTPENDKIMYSGEFRTPFRTVEINVKEVAGPVAGFGRSIDARGEDGERSFLEVESDLASIGFRRFIVVWSHQEDTPSVVQYKELERKNGPGLQIIDKQLLENANPPYFLVKNDRIEKRISCEYYRSGAVLHRCNILFMWGPHRLVTAYFSKDYVGHASEMADKIKDRLIEFEQAAQNSRLSSKVK